MLTRPWLGVLAVLGLPLAVGAWLLTGPERNNEYLLPTEHFFVVAVVALLALGVAGLTALQARRYELQWVALGFMAMAGFFSVHALSTPGVMLHLLQESGYGYSSASGGQDMVRAYDGTVVGVSAYLSLLVPSLLFALSTTRLAGVLSRRLPEGAAVVITTVLLAGYAVLAGTRGDVIATLPFAYPPLSMVGATVAVGLLLFAGWQLGRTYMRTRFPTHGAMAVAFIHLAQAQVLMATGRFWTLAWWEYHALMLAAVVIALGALGVELNRRRSLERLVSPEVVERIVAGDLRRLLEGEQRIATIFFADLRDSTMLSEQRSPREVVALMNAYVGAMAQAVVDHGGMVQRYLGDGIMAIFGAFDDVPSPSTGAVAAAETVLALRSAVERLNRDRARHGEPPLRFGVGIHTGEVLLGAIGLQQQSDITAFGDTVNVAARLQELTKQFGVDVVLSSETVECLPEAQWSLRPLGHASIRGRSSAVLAYTFADSVPDHPAAEQEPEEAPASSAVT